MIANKKTLENTNQETRFGSKVIISLLIDLPRNSMTSDMDLSKYSRKSAKQPTNCNFHAPGKAFGPS